MSTLLVNKIKSVTGDTVTISGSNIIVQGKTTLGDTVGTDTVHIHDNVNVSGSLIISGGIEFKEITQKSQTNDEFTGKHISINGRRGNIFAQVSQSVAVNGGYSIELRNTEINFDSLVVVNAIGNPGSFPGSGSSPSILTGSVVSANVIKPDTASINFINYGQGVIPHEALFSASFTLL